MWHGSSQSIYKQRFDDTDLTTGMQNEQSVFKTAIVPLKLRIGDTNIWNKPKPSSPHFCRSLQIQYQKETTKLIAEEEISLRKQIENLEDYILDLHLFSNEKHGSIKIKIVVDLTMLDGKLVNAVMALNSSQSCNVCFAKPSDMNNLVKIRMFTPDEKSLKMGISTLHCWVKLFEYVLHLGYKMKIKKYQAISEEHKLSVFEQKN
nr:uncharacterized protein LOC124814601 [Hydra vulgaris]